MKILIVDDHPIVRAGLRRLLAADKDYEITEAATGKEALTLARAYHPDLVILDLNLPGIGGFDLIARFVRDTPRPRILVLSMHDDPVFAMLERATAPQAVAAIAALTGFITAIWMRKRSPEWSPDAFALPMAASLLCAPVVYPWYLLWLVPFLRSTATLPIAIWTVSIIPTYYVWYLRTLGRPWLVPGWITLLEYGSVVIVSAIIMLSRGTRSVPLQRSAEEAP